MTYAEYYYNQVDDLMAEMVEQVADFLDENKMEYINLNEYLLKNAISELPMLPVSTRWVNVIFVTIDEQFGLEFELEDSTILNIDDVSINQFLPIYKAIEDISNFIKKNC